MQKTMKECTTGPHRPDIDFDLITNTISTVVTTIENACLQKGTMFLDKDEGVLYRHFDRYSFIEDRMYIGHDRAHMSLYGPLENIKLLFEDYKRQIANYGLRAKYMSEVTLPWLCLQRARIFQSDAKSLSKIRTALHENGRIDDHYVKSFAKFVHQLQAPMAELSNLADLLTNICDEGDELLIPPAGTIAIPRHSSSAASSTAGRTSTTLRSSRSRGTITETSRSANTIDFTKPPSPSPSISPYFTKPSHASCSSPVPTEPHRPPSQPPSPFPSPSIPKWKHLFSSSLNLPLAHFSVHPPDLAVFRRAASHAHSALKTAESCIETCERGGEKAREMRPSWQEWMAEVEKGEERIEREGGSKGEDEDEDEEERDQMTGFVQVMSWQQGLFKR